MFVKKLMVAFTLFGVLAAQGEVINYTVSDIAGVPTVEAGHKCHNCKKKCNKCNNCRKKCNRNRC